MSLKRLSLNQIKEFDYLCDTQTIRRLEKFLQKREVKDGYTICDCGVVIKNLKIHLKREKHQIALDELNNLISIKNKYLNKKNAII